MTKSKLLSKVKPTKKTKENTFAKKTIKNKPKTVGSILLTKTNNAVVKKIKKDGNSKPPKVEKILKAKTRDLSPTETEDSIPTEIGDLTPNELCSNKVKKAVEATFELITKSENTTLLDDEVPMLLQISCIKIPKCPLRTVRYTLPHSLVNDNTEICLIVLDLKRGRKIDPEPTEIHYQDLLAEAGIKNVKVLPFTQLKLEYSQFEAKKRLLNLYDVFLVDAKISGHVFHILGKTFVKARKLPTSVRMNQKDLKHEFTKALNKTSIMLTPRGNTTITKVGHSKMTSQEVTDNIIAASNWLKSNYPGGWENIESIYVKSPTTLSIPIHISLKSPNEVKVPVIVHHKRNIYKDVKGELSTIPGATVSFDADGTMKVLKEEVDGISDVEFEDFDLEEPKDNKKQAQKADISKAKPTEMKENDENDEENRKIKMSKKLSAPKVNKKVAKKQEKPFSMRLQKNSPKAKKNTNLKGKVAKKNKQKKIVKS
ncbi:ribosomal L1 domain-containing protein CG13096-like [Ctenocephalides felis]|uniref:ribosomal L1 domain-containing protein CG13096-like n=1 Tax=Ctenocephalides felis TaxID=7515 RepID=UPI000E6E56A6|nr:ribosomal L1 domain-containing protein CG13096-like [Ctenocephalides felis]